MAALQCEICGGKLIGKPGGMFECDSCGVEYSTEWAKAKVQEIRGTVKIEGPVEVQGSVKLEGGVSVESLLSRGNLALEDEDWDKARELFDQVLSIEPENAGGYLGAAMASQKTPAKDQFALVYADSSKPIVSTKNIARARQFAGTELKTWLDDLMTQREADKKKRGEERQRKIFILAEKRKALIPAMGLISCALGVRADGTVAVAGYRNRDQVSSWTGIVAVTAGIFHTVGVKADGTVVAVGDNKYGQCAVSGWTDIVAVAVGELHTVGLRRDGTVVAVGSNDQGRCRVSGWTDIVAVAAGNCHTMGLKADGTVVAVGDNRNGQCEVSGWTDIVAVATKFSHTVGVKADGTVVAVGDDCEGSCEVSDWTDIVTVACGDYYTVGLKVDGTVVAAGDNECGQCEVSGWTDVVAVSEWGQTAVGLKSDGTVVAAGRNIYGHEIQTWKLFNSLDSLDQERANARIRS